jgi:hypothetical protein
MTETYNCEICGNEFTPHFKLIMTPEERIKATRICSGCDPSQKEGRLKQEEREPTAGMSAYYLVWGVCIFIIAIVVIFIIVTNPIYRHIFG